MTCSSLKFRTRKALQPSVINHRLLPLETVPERTDPFGPKPRQPALNSRLHAATAGMVEICILTSPLTYFHALGSAQHGRRNPPVWV